MVVLFFYIFYNHNKGYKNKSIVRHVTVEGLIMIDSWKNIAFSFL